MGRRSVIYNAAGLALEGEFTRADLLPAEEGAVPYRFVLRSDPASRPPLWVHEWSDPSKLGHARCGRTVSGYVLRFEAVADYVCDLGAREIRCHPQRGVESETLTGFLIGQVMPRLANLERPPVLHASAVAWRGVGLVFAGAAGAGKSTLAAGLCIESCGLLSDDCVALRASGPAFECLPTARGLRLSDRAVEVLSSSAAPLAVSDAVPLRALFILDPAQAPDLPPMARMRRTDALLRLVRYSYQMDPHDRRQLAAQFDAVSRIVALVPVFALRVPRGLGRLREISRFVLEQIEAVGAGSV
ncbi:MAG: hypothetical protein A3H96_24400 [Acidobacteria bacterium RIFCSPLOWO2_02_FULL_67_36]|nr:MAG: hypothetical protein A3H96_24400 [Acidobacteria bacterium RIFCSPLOWO2_02_FULL_67_36]OFW18992.1 MAG: hypothetical protein A3G21_04650 [Acidobacteria bacterium RIFCSPLOWO2_12_FULL_66_21]